MSNTRAYNVVRVDTTAAFPDVLSICSIKYIGAASGTALIQKANSSGAKLWEESGTANAYNPDLDIESKQGIYVTVTNSAVVYLYLE